MQLVTEGNLIYSIQQIGSATVKQFYGYVVPPQAPQEPPDRVAELTAQVNTLTEQLAVTIATVDFLLGIE